MSVLTDAEAVELDRLLRKIKAAILYNYEKGGESDEEG